MAYFYWEWTQKKRRWWDCPPNCANVKLAEKYRRWTAGKGGGGGGEEGTKAWGGKSPPLKWIVQKTLQEALQAELEDFLGHPKHLQDRQPQLQKRLHFQDRKDIYRRGGLRGITGAQVWMLNWDCLARYLDYSVEIKEDAVYYEYRWDCELEAQEGNWFKQGISLIWWRFNLREYGIGLSGNGLISTTSFSLSLRTGYSKVKPFYTVYKTVLISASYVDKFYPTTAGVTEGPVRHW